MRIVKLGDVCDMKSGGTPRRGEAQYYGGDIPWAKIGDLETSSDGIVHSTEESISPEGLKAINNRIFQKGTLFLAMYGSVGKVAFAGKPMSCNQAILGINANSKALVNLKYLKYWFEYYKDTLLNKARGVALKNISATIVKNLQIPLPPLPVQKQIADILDTADAYRQKTRALLDKYDELAQSIFLDMFGDPVKNEKGWEKNQISDLGKVTTGNTPSRRKQEYYGKHIEWIKTTNINNPNIFLTKADEYLTELGLDNGRFVEKNSILVTCIAGSRKVLGNAAIADRKVAFNQQINAFTPRNGNVLFWFYHFKIAKKYVQSFSSGGMKGMISKSNFEKIEFINPPTDAQEEFARCCKLIHIQIEYTRISLKRSEELFNGLLQTSFSKR